MAQNFTTSYVNTNVPGAYINTSVISSSSGLATSGVMVIIGEADGGPDYSVTTLANNFFGPSALNKVRSIYTSGPIVDAFSALTAPSNDPDIVGSANSIFVIKTNKGTKASEAVDTNYGTMSALNYGIAGNLLNFSVTSIESEMQPEVSGNTIGSYAGLSGAAFTVRVNGGAAALITPAGIITNQASLIASLNAAFLAASVTLTASAGTAPNTIQISLPVDMAAYRKGYGKSFELIDSTPGDLAALGLSAQLVVSSQEPAVEVKVIDQSAGINQTFDVSPAIALQVGYEGTTATMTINATTLSTTVVGGIGASISIPLSQYKTVGQIASYINSQPGYSALVDPSANQSAPSSLDEVTAIGIASMSGDMPGRVKNAVSVFENVVNTSTAVSFASTAVAGLPNPSNVAFLAGGTRGATQAIDIVNTISQMSGIQCNIIVPLFSQDASKDIAAGITDPASTYTISAVNELIKSHCIEFSTPQLKRNRMAILSINDTYANAKAQAQSLATYRCAVTCQQVVQVNSQGVNTLFQPWYAAVVAGGMQSGGFYKSIVAHLANIVSIQDPVGYDSGDPSDVSDAIMAGLLTLTQDNSGIKWVSDQLTFGLNTNFVYNSIQAVYLSDILALDLAQSFQNNIVGKSIADVSAAAALSFLQQRFDFYKKSKMVTSSNDAPLGFKNASIQIAAPAMYVSVEAKLTSSILFVGIDLALSAVQQSAS